MGIRQGGDDKMPRVLTKFIGRDFKIVCLILREVDEIVTWPLYFQSGAGRAGRKGDCGNTSFSGSVLNLVEI